MKHLTVDEIINFVSLTELNSEAIELSATVNGHIRNCENCLKLVSSFQMIYDEFIRLEMNNDFKWYLDNNISGLSANNESTVENQSVLEELDM